MAGSQDSNEGSKRLKIETPTVFNADLLCSSTESSRKERIVFDGENEPEFVYDVMKKVETDFSIPVCVQTVTYEDHPLAEDVNLKEEGIRHGDCFKINYSSEGDCQKITEVYRWLMAVRHFLEKEDESITTGEMSPTLENLLAIGIRDEIVEDLAFKYLFPWLDARKYANKLYFISCRGLEEMMGLYTQIVKRPWSETVINLQVIEYSILRVLWNLSETFEIRRQMLSHNCLPLCMKSLLREFLTPNEDMIAESDNLSRTVLIEVIAASLGLLCNLSELPECHMEIATHPGCLDQLACISVCPNVRPISMQLVATLFLCLAYTPQTHPHLTKPHLIGHLLEANNRQRSSADYEEDEDGGTDEKTSKMMLRYFTQVFLSQVIIVSPQCIPDKFEAELHSAASGFLSTADYRLLREGEVKHWYVWSTFLPYVKLFYQPHHRTSCQPQRMVEESDSSALGVEEDLRVLSLKTILLALQNMLSRSNHREVLWKENLQDFVTCVPSYVPQSLVPQAEELVRIVGSDGYQLQPPKLLNLVKAKLASVHFGLEQILSKSVGEIVTELLCRI